MTRDGIIRMAREAGINLDPASPSDDGIDTWYGNQWLPCGAIVKLVEIAQAAEREACATWYAENGWLLDEDDVANAMRAREK